MQVLLSGDNVFAGFASYSGVLGQRGFKVAVDTLNTVGPNARREMVKAEARSTGLSTRILARALHETRATVTAPVYTIFSAGGEIALRFFGAKETNEGVAARVLGERKVFAGTFMKAGSFARGRVEKPNWNRQVFRRTGAQTAGFRPNSKRHMDQFVPVRSGVVIPREMVRGEPLRAFETMSAQFPGFVLRRLSELQLNAAATGQRNYGSAGVRSSS